MKIIQLRGTNGTGKTTCMKQFVELRKFEPIEYDAFGHKIQALWDKEAELVVLGKYASERATGGIDGLITDKNVLKGAIIEALKKMHPRALLFEGLVYGLTYKFACDVNKIAKNHGAEYIGIVLLPPIDVCVERVMARNGKSAIQYDVIQDKWFAAQNAYFKLKRAGVHVEAVDSSKYEYKDMHKIIEDVL